MAHGDKTRSAEVTIDIDGVKPHTRIGDLTVDQFIKLVFQLIPQLPKGAAQDSRKGDASHVLSEIRKSILRSNSINQSAVSKSVREAQLAILDEMPELIKQTTKAAVKATGRRHK